MGLVGLEHVSTAQGTQDTEDREHHRKDLATGQRSIVRLEGKLGEPQPMTTYLVVTRYDFDAAGVLQDSHAPGDTSKISC